MLQADLGFIHFQDTNIYTIKFIGFDRILLDCYGHDSPLLAQSRYPIFYKMAIPPGNQIIDILVKNRFHIDCSIDSCQCMWVERILYRFWHNADTNLGRRESNSKLKSLLTNTLCFSMFRCCPQNCPIKCWIQWDDMRPYWTRGMNQRSAKYRILP